MEEKSKMTQKSKILDYIRENGSATIREIFIYCNVNSPAKRLSELRSMGLITEAWESKTNANGETKRFKRYYLVKGAAA